jgi:hypothetical protein
LPGTSCLFDLYAHYRPVSRYSPRCDSNLVQSVGRPGTDLRKIPDNACVLTAGSVPFIRQGKIPKHGIVKKPKPWAFFLPTEVFSAYREHHQEDVSLKNQADTRKAVVAYAKKTGLPGAAQTLIQVMRDVLRDPPAF